LYFSDIIVAIINGINVILKDAFGATGVLETVGGCRDFQPHQLIKLQLCPMQ